MNSVGVKRGFVGLIGVTKDMAPSRRKGIAIRHLVCVTCSSWMDFNSSVCTNSWAEMQGGTCVFACKGCREVARRVGEVEDLRICTSV